MRANDLVAALEFIEFHFPNADVDLSGNSLMINGTRGKVDLRTGVVVLKGELGGQAVFMPGELSTT